MASPMRARLGEDRYGSVTRRVVFGMPNTGVTVREESPADRGRATWWRMGTGKREAMRSDAFGQMRMVVVFGTPNTSHAGRV